MLINNIRKSPTCPIRNTIHAPTRGATSAVAWKWKLHIISIHAPTRGATAYVRKTGLGRDISIHAPTRGATTWSDWSGQTKETFQSTLLQEERREILKLTPDYYDFNPRSYKRSDLPYCLFLYLFKNFNPRSYKRSDNHTHLSLYLSF